METAQVFIRRRNVYIAPNKSNPSHPTIFIETQKTKRSVTGDANYFLIDDAAFSGYRHERTHETYHIKELRLVGTICASVSTEKCDQVLGNMPALRLDSEQVMVGTIREGYNKALKIARLRCNQGLKEMVRANYLKRLPRLASYLKRLLRLF